MRTPISSNRTWVQWPVAGKTPLHRAGLIFFMAALLFVLSGCRKSGAGAPAPEPSVEVVIGKPDLMRVEDTVAAVGTVEANERVEIKPEASGIIESIFFREGQRVAGGEKLIELDSTKETALVAQAQAEEKLARSNLDRAKLLAGTRAVSEQELDQLQGQVEVRAALRRVQEELLTERLIQAPFGGTLGPRLVSPGQYVTVGTPLVTLVDDSHVKIRFRLPERLLPLVRLGQVGRLSVGAYAQRWFEGKVDLIDPEVDEVTRTVGVRLVAPNEERLLKPGMFAHVELRVGEREKGLVITESALVPSLDQFSVYVVEEGRARLKPVKIGTRLPGKVEIREGLSADQPIVTHGTQKLVDGMKVTPSRNDRS